MPSPSPPATIPLRVEALRASIEAAGADALVVSRIQNVRYLSGFTGSSAALLISQAGSWLFTDSRYAEQAAAEAPDFRIEVTPGPPSVVAARRAGPCRVGFEAEAISYEGWETMSRVLLDSAGATLAPCRGLVEGLRSIKSAGEIDLIKKAVGIAAEAFESTLPLVKPGMPERDLALEIEFRMKQAGAEDVAFDLIIASGPRSSLPHGRASERRLGAGEFVVFDIGARYRGYHSDMTRTVFTGRPDETARRLYQTVLEAQRSGIESVAPGADARAVDAAARSVIAAAGYGERFGHGTGHGVGLEVHEAPRIGARSSEVLAAGMVLTIEPGIYIPGMGGVRIEDIVVVTESGRSVLTPTPKDIWSLE